MISGFGGFMAFGILIYLVIIVFFMWLLWDFVGSARRVANALEMIAAKFRDGSN